MKKRFYGIAVLILFAVSIVVINIYFWNSVLAQNAQLNYERGFTEGQAEGYSEGNETGYNKGHNAG